VKSGKKTGWLHFETETSVNGKSVLLVTESYTSKQAFYQRVVTEANNAMSMVSVFPDCHARELPIRLTGFYSAKDFPDYLRRVKYFDAVNSKLSVFLTNNFPSRLT
jgi:hypothetical protein